MEKKSACEIKKLRSGIQQQQNTDRENICYSSNSFCHFYQWNESKRINDFALFLCAVIMNLHRHSSNTTLNGYKSYRVT